MKIYMRAHALAISNIASLPHTRGIIAPPILVLSHGVRKRRLQTKEHVTRALNDSRKVINFIVLQ